MSAAPHWPGLESARSTGLGAHTERRWNRVEVDPVSLQVIGGALQSIAHEMAELLVRMAYSSVMRESRDIGAALLDFDGRQLCESDSTPMHCGSLPAYVRGIDRKHRGRYRPGDIYLHNHPYHGASHSPDYGVLLPLFAGSVHVGFAGCTGHMVDIGAADPGFSVDVPDFFAEGQILDAVKLHDGGARREDLWSLIMDNVRTPEANSGDLEAMIACCRLGEERFAGLVTKHGLDQVMSAAEAWMDYAERRLRARIELLPDGEYPAPDAWLEDDGKHFGKPLKIATRVIVRGSDICVDLSGSSDQTTTGFNCPFEGSVLPAVNFAVRALLLDETAEGAGVPQNDGVFRPVHAHAPKGSIFNPVYPRGCEARFTQINRIPDQVLQALGSVLPERVTGGNSANVSCFVYSFESGEGKYRINVEINEGSYGGRNGRDGLDAVDTLMANTRNNPLEEMELSAPMLCERYELRGEAPAAGRWRGGMGAVKTWRFLEDAAVSSTGDNRSDDPPRGIFGGADGLPGEVRLNPRTPEEQQLPAKISHARFTAGDRLEITLVSGGGYGDPLERDPQHVAEDVLDGLLSIDEARESYGVVIDSAGNGVDLAASRRLRESLRGSRQAGASGTSHGRHAPADAPAVIAVAAQEEKQ